MDITGKTVASVARRMPQSTGTRETDLVSPQHWLMQFWEASTGLQQSFEAFLDCMANGSQPWVDYRSLIPGYLIGLENFPVVRPDGVGEIW